MIYSKEQLAIFDAQQNSNRNLAVNATAGSGKTTTLIECARLIPKVKSSIFLSFSNFIVNELKERVPPHVAASTLHSHGCRIVLSHYKGAKFNENKYFQLALDTYPKKEISKTTFRECYIINDIVNYIRMTLTPTIPEKIAEMCDYYSIDWDPKLIEKSIEILDTKRKLKYFDFTDMIYIPATNHGIIEQCYDYIFLDECQDSNNCQLQFVDGLLKMSGRIIAVGDKRQAIYSFSGSSIYSFENIEKKFNTVSLPLSVSYRCGKKIVEEAVKIYPEIQPYDKNVDGEVRRGSIDEIEQGDILLSRNNAPLISIFFYLVAREKKCHIVGKDIEKGIVNLVESCLTASKNKFIDNLIAKLDKLKEELIQNKVSKPQLHPRYRVLFEKIEVILLILSKVESTKNVVPKIHEIFNEKKEGIKLMTIHKSKGTENNRVFLLDRYNLERLLPSKFAQKDWEKVQEQNLKFVAYTRSKLSLILFDFNDEEPIKE